MSADKPLYRRMQRSETYAAENAPRYCQSSGVISPAARYSGCRWQSNRNRIREAALDGLGIAFLPEDEVSPHFEHGRLIRLLEEWCPRFPGYYLYYPSRRQPSPVFSLVLEALRLKQVRS